MLSTSAGCSVTFPLSNSINIHSMPGISRSRVFQLMAKGDYSACPMKYISSSAQGRATSSPRSLLEQAEVKVEADSGFAGIADTPPSEGSLV